MGANGLPGAFTVDAGYKVFSASAFMLLKSNPQHQRARQVTLAEPYETPVPRSAACVCYAAPFLKMSAFIQERCVRRIDLSFTRNVDFDRLFFDINIKFVKVHIKLHTLSARYFANPI